MPWPSSPLLFSFHFFPHPDKTKGAVEEQIIVDLGNVCLTGSLILAQGRVWTSKSKDSLGQKDSAGSKPLPLHAADSSLIPSPRWSPEHGIRAWFLSPELGIPLEHHWVCPTSSYLPNKIKIRQSLSYCTFYRSGCPLIFMFLICHLYGTEILSLFSSNSSKIYSKTQTQIVSTVSW